MTHQFKVGDRVRVLKSNGSPMRPGDEGVITTVWKDGVVFDVKPDVKKTRTDFDWTFALHMLEAAAPKPPTLRQAAEALLARWPTDQHEDSPLKDEADALRAAIRREEAS